jgi:hypothetical protein
MDRITKLKEELALAFPEMDHQIVLPSKYRGPREIELHSTYKDASSLSGHKTLHLIIGVELPDTAEELIEKIKEKADIDTK